MHNILLDIVERKKKDLNMKKKRIISNGLAENGKNKKSDFMSAILKPNHSDIAIIAEIKLASPTSPNLGSKTEIKDRASSYEQAGADAISYITESHYFKGDIKFIPELKRIVSVPILQKDFVIDPYQIYESKLAGADSLLLIARLVGKETLNEFVNLCKELYIEPVVEINNTEDLEKALETKTNIIAVNARNLETFKVNVEHACQLIEEVPNKFIKLGFSGIYDFSQIKQYKEAGSNGVLVGSSLMRAKNIQLFFEGLRKPNV